MKTALDADAAMDKKMSAKQLGADIKRDKKQLAKKRAGAKTVLHSAYRRKTANDDDSNA